MLLHFRFLPAGGNECKIQFSITEKEAVTVKWHVMQFPMQFTLLPVNQLGAKHEKVSLVKSSPLVSNDL